MNSTSIDNPVMTIIRERISKKLVSDFRTKGEFFCFSTEFHESRSFWAVVGMECFPLQYLQDFLSKLMLKRLVYLLPSKLVIFIVNFDNCIHLSWIWVFVLPAPTFSNHRVPKHLLRRIQPSSVGAVFWDRARLALC